MFKVPQSIVVKGFADTMHMDEALICPIQSEAVLSDCISSILDKRKVTIYNFQNQILSCFCSRQEKCCHLPLVPSCTTTDLSNKKEGDTCDSVVSVCRVASNSHARSVGRGFEFSLCVILGLSPP